MCVVVQQGGHVAVVGGDPAQLPGLVTDVADLVFDFSNITHMDHSPIIFINIIDTPTDERNASNKPDSAQNKLSFHLLYNYETNRNRRDKFAVRIYQYISLWPMYEAKRLVSESNGN